MLLIIGNRRYSSWSLRPWLLLRHYAIPFEEKLIGLDRPETESEILRFSPSGKVPALIDGDLTVWDSLAIAEYLAEKYPDRQMWPREPSARARARAVSAEMHSGFQKMREHLSHDIKKQLKGYDSSAAIADIARVQAIWRECLARSGGPFLFGEFSIADAMYAPVANRFVTYDVSCDGECSSYVATIRALPAHREWIEAALVETLRVPRYE